MMMVLCQIPGFSTKCKGGSVAQQTAYGDGLLLGHCGRNVLLEEHQPKVQQQQVIHSFIFNTPFISLEYTIGYKQHRPPAISIVNIPIL